MSLQLLEVVAVRLLISILFLAGFGTGVLGAPKKAPTPPSFAEFDDEALEFSRKAVGLDGQSECLPLHVAVVEKVDVDYLHCSEKAKREDAKERKLSGDLTVPSGIAQRFNFWRRIYSLWSAKQNVLHVAEYPEVVLEIWDTSRLDLDRKAEKQVLKKLNEKRRRQYAKVFLELHKYRHKPDLWSPTMKRVAAMMAHIPNDQKFLLASRDLRLQKGQREYIETGLSFAPKYMPFIEEEFSKQGVPPIYARIAFIESSFNIKALSKVGASGVYQIMPSTGRQYLIMTPGIDERNDPVKASRAAAKLLRLNYGIVGSWPLAVTAYNHGVGGIQRAVRSAGTRDIVKLIQRYDGPNFGFASKNFYSGFLGLVATLDESKVLFPKVTPVDPLKFEMERVGGMTVAQASKKFKVTALEMVTYNPDISWSFIRRNSVFPGRYQLKVPFRSHLNPPQHLVSDQ